MIELTLGQRLFVERTREEHGNAQVDVEGTRQARVVEPLARQFVVVSADKPPGVLIWVIDELGAVVLEGGAEPE